jgi:alcohol dehydrogenase
MMGLAFARALFPHAPIVADIDADKRAAALKAGAAAAYDPADRDARKALVKDTGGVHGAVDFVGSDSSLAFATGCLAKGGKVVITGLIGGTYTTPIAMFPLRVFTVEGTMTGTLDEANEMMALARAGKVPPVPITERPLSAAQAALDDLRGGRIIGRVVLVP